MDAAFGEDGDSEEEDAIVNQVLDEIGISLNERVRCFRFDIRLVALNGYLDGHRSSSACWSAWNGFQSTSNERCGCRNRTNVSQSEILNLGLISPNDDPSFYPGFCLCT